MGFGVCMSGMCQCTFGTVPCPLVVTPENKTINGSLPMATIMDNVMGKNISTFGMCSSMANPQVAAATAAAFGVLTPMPCIPLLTAPWTPGAATVMINNKPALNNSSKLMCGYGGVISITNPGTTNVQVP